MPRRLDAAGKAMWKHVVKTRAAWLAESDGPELQALCETWSLRCKAFRAVAADPADKLARCAFVSYQTTFDRLASKFGLTPQDRARLGEVGPAEADPAAEFIA